MFDRLPFAISDLVLWVGVAAMAFGAVTYGNGALSVSAVFTGLPLLLGAAVMKAVELKPVPAIVVASEAVLAAATEQATEIQKQIKFDITKYSYGADARLDQALEALKLKGRFDADYPRLIGYREELQDGHYTFVLRFDSPKVKYDKWQESYNTKMQTFFGRDVKVELAQWGKDGVEVTLISQKSLQTPE